MSWKFIAILLVIMPAALIGQCFLSSPVSITPESSTDIIISVSGLTPEDLSSTQGICAINIEWEHGRQENLRFELISPAGQVVSLIGPGISNGAFSGNINWNVNFTPCALPTAPDPGILPVWDNDQQWLSFTNYIGTYHPHDGCLEDFDTGSANGDWILNITNRGTNSGDLIFIEIFFCEGSASCSQCVVDAGSFSPAQIVLCEGADQLSQLDSTSVYGALPSPGTDIRYLVDDGAGGLLVLEAWEDVQALPEGPLDIQVITTTDDNLPLIDAISSLGELQAILDRGLCLSISDNSLAVRYIDAVTIENIEIDLCEGDTVRVDNMVFTEAIDTSFFPSSAMMCDTLIQLNIEAVQVEAVIAQNGNPVVCGQRQFLDGSQSIASLQADFQWSTTDGNILNGLGSVATINAGGTYFLELNDRGCIDVDSIVLTAIDTFFLTLEQVPVDCFGDSLNIILRDSFDINAGPIALRFPDITGPPGSTTNLLGNLINVSETGLYTIQSQAGTCMREDTITVIDNTQELMFIAAAEDTLGCNSQEVIISLTTNALNPIFAFDGPEAIPDGNSNPSVMTAGIYNVTVTDENMCTASTSIEVVSQLDFPSVLIQDIVIPCGGQTTLEAAVTGNIDSIRWTDTAGELLTGTPPIVSDTGTYLLSVFDMQGCNLLDVPVMVTADDTPLFTTTDAVLIPCSTGSVMVTSNDPSVQVTTNSIIWTDVNGQVISNEPEILLSEEETVMLTLTDGNGCIGTHTVTARLQSAESTLQDINLEIEAGNCLSLDSTVLNLIGPLDQVSQILVNGETVDIASSYLLPDGDYDLALLDNNGCRLDTMIILMNDAIEPVVSLGSDVTLAAGESYSIPIMTAGIDTDNILTWSLPSLLSCDQCLDPIIQVTQDTLIVLEITDVNGCQAIDSLLITVLEDISPPTPPSTGMTDFFMPTIFQPALSPPDNQLVLGINQALYTDYMFFLYDRWGNLIFQSEGPADQNEIFLWDGRFRNREAEQGVYVYVAILLQVDGLEVVNSGHITLLR